MVQELRTSTETIQPTHFDFRRGFDHSLSWTATYQDAGLPATPLIHSTPGHELGAETVSYPDIFGR